MRRILLLLYISVIVGVVLFAQSPQDGSVANVVTQKTLVSDMGQARVAYQTALQDWASYEPYLESELNQQTPARRKQKIDEARDRRMKVMETKAKYLEATARYFQSFADQFSTPETRHVDVAEMKGQTDAISRDLLGQKAALTEEISKLGTDTSSFILKHTLESELAELGRVKDRLDEQSAILSAPGMDDKGEFEQNRKEIAAKLQLIVQNLNQQRSDVDKSTKAWTRYYTLMATAAKVDGGTPAPAANPAPDASRQPAQRTGVVAPPPPSTSTGNGAPQSYGTGLYAGVWELSPGMGAGAVRITSARLTITEQNGVVQGVLEMAYDGDRGNTPITLDIQKGVGRAGKTTLDWKVRGATHIGKIELSPPDTHDIGDTMLATITESSNPIVPLVDIGLTRTR